MLKWSLSMLKFSNWAALITRCYNFLGKEIVIYHLLIEGGYHFQEKNNNL
jgi:hypothetical protein